MYMCTSNVDLTLQMYVWWLLKKKRKLITPSLDQHFCLIFVNTEHQYSEGESLKDIMTLLILFCRHRQLATSQRSATIHLFVEQCGC